MVDVTAKMPTERLARAEAVVILGRALAARLRRAGALSKGNVLETARLAGIRAPSRPRTSSPVPSFAPLDVVEVHATIVGGSRAHRDHGARRSRRHGLSDGSPDCGQRRGADRVRMCKAASKGHRHRPHSPAGENPGR